MKKITLLLLLLSMALIQAPAVRATAPDVFYGVDFSLVKVYGATESAADFVRAFDNINGLFVQEYGKYNPDKAFKTKNMPISLKMVRSLTEHVDQSELLVDSNDYLLTKNQISRHVGNYDTGSDRGTGAILIADLLDKSKSRATYHAVIFDIETKEIISVRKVSGKAKGFGLRNFWARSVRESLKQLAKSKW